MSTPVSVQLGPELFAFVSFHDWCDTAREAFALHGVTSRDTVIVDMKGRVLTSGREFARARDDNSYPVRVYHFDVDYDTEAPNDNA